MKTKHYLKIIQCIIVCVAVSIAYVYDLISTVIIVTLMMWANNFDYEEI